MRAVSFLHICSNQFILLLGSQRSFFSSSPPPPFFWFSPLLTAPCPNTQVHSRSLRLHLILCCIWNLKMAYFFRTLYILMFTILNFWEMIFSWIHICCHDECLKLLKVNICAWWNSDSHVDPERLSERQNAKTFTSLFFPGFAFLHFRF